MESSKALGGAEEYSSCESGWTMYIDDTFHGNENSDVFDEDDDNDDHRTEDRAKDTGGGGDDDDDDANDDNSSDDGDDDESDDSMASDASSGPSNQLPKGNNEHAAAKYHSKQDNHQHRKQMGNSANKATRDGKKESVLKAKTRAATASHVQRRGKVSKTK